MWIRILVVAYLVVLGVFATVTAAGAVPDRAPPLQTAVPTTAVPAATNTPTVAPSSTPVRTATATSTPVPSATPTRMGQVDLQVLKTASTDLVPANGPLIYNITVVNTSSVGASSPQTTLTDVFPDGVVLASVGGDCTNTGSTFSPVYTCTVPPLAPNQSVSFSFTVRVGAASGTLLTNTAQVDPSNTVIETNESNNFASVTTTVGGTLGPTGTVPPTSTPFATSIPVEPAPAAPASPTVVPVPPAETLWVHILAPTQTYSVTDDPLWIAQPGELYWVSTEEDGWLLVVSEGDSKEWSVWIGDDERIRRMPLDRPPPPDAGISG